MPTKPFVIAVAPNGARKTKEDHPALPLSIEELVDTAVQCYEAGAVMMHFHVRDTAGRHTLEPAVYRPAIQRLEAELGDRMIFQVSSEAAGRYGASEQIELIKQLAPHCLSCGLREILPDRQSYDAGNRFLTELYRSGVLIQYIVYSPREVNWYEQLCDSGVIPGNKHFLLFVLGSYDTPDCISHSLDQYLSVLKRPSDWMACGFGKIEAELAQQAALLGGHIRVGFENNLFLADGILAPENSTLVKAAAKTGQLAGRQKATSKDAEFLHEKKR